MDADRAATATGQALRTRGTGASDGTNASAAKATQLPLKTILERPCAGKRVWGTILTGDTTAEIVYMGLVMSPTMTMRPRSGPVARTVLGQLPQSGN